MCGSTSWRQGTTSNSTGWRRRLREKEMRAVDTFGLLFGRPIDDSIYGLATGEAVAHLRYLERAGRAKLEIRDGVGWYHAA